MKQRILSFLVLSLLAWQGAQGQTFSDNRPARIVIQTTEAVFNIVDPDDVAFFSGSTEGEYSLQVNVRDRNDLDATGFVDWGNCIREGIVQGFNTSEVRPRSDEIFNHLYTGCNKPAAFDLRIGGHEDDVDDRCTPGETDFVLILLADDINCGPETQNSAITGVAGLGGAFTNLGRFCTSNTGNCQENIANFTVGTGGFCVSLRAQVVYSDLTGLTASAPGPYQTGDIVTFTAQGNLDGTSSYNWTLPSNASVLSGGGTGDNFVQIQFTTNTPSPGTIDLEVASPCAVYDATSASVILPVELLQFTASATQGAIALRWATANETNNAGFELQRRVAGPDSFEPVAWLGGRNASATYQFEDTDVRPNVPYQYRLKQVDFDGTEAYSNVVEASIGAQTAGTLTVYPNPVTDILRVELPTSVAYSQVALYNAAGQIVLQKTLDRAAHTALDLNALPNGVYLLRATATGQVLTQRVVKQ